MARCTTLMQLPAWVYRPLDLNLSLCVCMRCMYSVLPTYIISIEIPEERYLVRQRENSGHLSAVSRTSRPTTDSGATKYGE